MFGLLTAFAKRTYFVCTSSHRRLVLGSVPQLTHPCGLQIGAQRGVFHMPQPQQLPGPNADIWDWQMHGLCRGVDSSVFFHPDGERGRARAQREMRAKEMCRSCPVITQCRSHALAVGEPYGIWGGLSESERELLLKRGIRRAS
jgi:WhiB family transcriptional regulator, redox-sensing transcriptional regulator